MSSVKSPNWVILNPGEQVMLEGYNGKTIWATKCCDCGLEHVIHLEPKKDGILVTVWRMEDVAKHIFPVVKLEEYGSKSQKRRHTR